MTSFDQERLLALLERWNEPQLPDFFVDDVEEMNNEIARIGPESADALAQLLAEKTLESIANERVLSVFCGKYFDTFPEAMTAALIGQLDTEDPHLVLELLVDARAPKLSKTLIEKVRLDFDNVLLIESFIFALRRQGDETARQFLAQMPREKMKPESIATLNEHLAWLESHPAYRRAK